MLAELDFETCYRAAESRDARFDGVFFIAVTTTGVYCRPTCPSRMPRAKNTRFYRTAGAAEAAGFRACRRCHPQLASARAARAAGTLTERALQLIADGVVDEAGVGGLARRLGVSERHLHRTLLHEMGAGAMVLAENRRVHLATLLARSTTLPLTEIAFLSGYGSIRRFNEAMKARTGESPSDSRRHVHRPAPAAASAMTLRLSYRLPLHRGLLFGWLAARALPGVERVDGTTYARTVRLPHGAAWMEVGFDDPRDRCLLKVAVSEITDVDAAVRLARHLLDLDADPRMISAALSADSTMAQLAARFPGVRIPGCADGFELAVRAVIGQQISVAAARTFATRMVERWGMTPLTLPLSPDGRGTLNYLFPTAASLADAPLESIGLTAQQVATVRSLARAVASGELTLEPSSNRDDTRARLLAIPGVGDWTASYIAMRALRDPDAFPAGDLGLRRAAARLGLPDSEFKLRRYAERWRPWRSYAAMLLWGSLGSPPQPLPLGEG